MYGTIARMRLKPGMEEKFREASREEDSLKVPGYIGTYVYRMDNDPHEFYMAVMFDSKESYFANAHSPEQDARYREMLEMLEDEPEWHDGEVVYSSTMAETGTSSRGAAPTSM